MIISFLTLEIKFQYHYSIIANFVHVLIPWFYTRKTKKKMKEYYYYFIKCSIYYLKSFKLKKYQDIKYKIKKSLNNIIYQKWITLSSKIINPSLTDPFSSNTIIVHMDYVTHTWTRICSVHGLLNGIGSLRKTSGLASRANYPHLFQLVRRQGRT